MFSFKNLPEEVMQPTIQFIKIESEGDDSKAESVMTFNEMTFNEKFVDDENDNNSSVSEKCCFFDSEKKVTSSFRIFPKNSIQDSKNTNFPPMFAPRISDSSNGLVVQYTKMTRRVLPVKTKNLLENEYLSKLNMTRFHSDLPIPTSQQKINEKLDVHSKSVFKDMKGMQVSQYVNADTNLKRLENIEKTAENSTKCLSDLSNSIKNDYT